MKNKNILENIDILIEDIRNTNKIPSTPAIIGQQMVGSLVPRLVASNYANGPLTSMFTKVGLSTKDVAGIHGLNPAQVAANSVGYNVLGGLATSAVKPFIDKYQERKYGIIKPPDPRNLSQKITDGTLNTAKALTSSIGFSATKAAVGTLAATLAGPVAAPAAAAAATGLIGTIAMSPITAAVNRTLTKPITSLQQKIQDRRLQNQ